MPLILKVWSPDFDFKQELPRTMPLWVKFPNLLLKCWGPKTLSKVASRLGNPLFAGECTKKQIRVSFAGVLIDMDMTKYLPLEIKLVDKSGKTFTQDVIYEWRPVFCKTCMMYEHTCKGENVKENQQHAKKRQETKAAHKGERKEPIKQWVSKLSQKHEPTVSTIVQVQKEPEQQPLRAVQPELKKTPDRIPTVATSSQPSTSWGQRAMSYAALVQHGSQSKL